MKHYPRLEFAQGLADALMGKVLFSDASNGLFLAAPRRTGKSTFLQADLLPELTSRGVVVVYVDLWADQKNDPGDLIADAIAQALRKRLGLVAKTAKAAGLDSVQIGGLKIDLSKIGRHDGITLTDALRALHETAKAPVALIIDEAQHSLTSEAGENTMIALKSARDQLNRPGDPKLLLVMSGSDRDKLLRLVNTNASPFYGSKIERMPELGADFIAHIAERIVQQRPELGPIDQAALLQAFELFGSRPQFFIDALGKVLHPLAVQDERFEKAMHTQALDSQKTDEAQMQSDYLALKPLEQAVLWRMLERGARFRPYDADALRFYKSTAGHPATPAQVQKALENLRNHQPSMVWKSARGEYVIDDANMHRWYTQRVAAGSWPPAEPQLDWVGE
jgi:hypothetical protein